MARAASGLAEQLVAQAQEALHAGRPLDGAALLDQAAGVHRQAGRWRDEARTLLLCATMRRLAGDLDAADTRVARAESLARSRDPELQATALAERAEVYLAQGKATAAAGCLGRALDLRPDAPAPVRAALLHRRALARVGGADLEGALADLTATAEAYVAAGDRVRTATVLVERASACQQSDHPDFPAALAAARSAVDATGDHGQEGELDLLEAAEAVRQGRLEVARLLTLRARQHALDGVAPTTYVGATLALAELEDRLENRVAAYEALATGWVTLADLLGRDASRTVFQPKLDELAARWGADGFARVVEAYEARRRRERGAAGSDAGSEARTDEGQDA